MTILYNIIIYLYLISIYLSSLFNTKAKIWLRGRKGLFRKLKDTINNEDRIVWFHCASLGEFEQGKPIIEGYRIENPEDKILLTFFSPSGFEIQKNTPIADFVFYLPIDTITNSKKFITIVKPIKVIFIKYEFWFNYMKEIKKQEIPFYHVCTILRNDQLFFKCKWFAKQLQNVSHFFVQNVSSANLLKSIGLTNTTISGDTRFDNVKENRDRSKKLPIIEALSKSKTTIIFGSTWPKDERIISQLINKNQQYNYIIAPHELHDINKLKNITNSLLYSKANTINVLSTNVLIIDNIGMLSSIYKYGDIAYIGGGFNAGIHNILEPATFGLPIIFGPNYHKSQEAEELINKECAISISNEKELIAAIKHFNIFEKDLLTDYVTNNSGATKIILDSI